MIIYILKFLLVTLSVALADICWVYYFIKVEERKAMAAGLWSGLIVILGAISIESYVKDWTFIFASMLGAFVGTYYSIAHKKKKEDKNKNQ